MVTLECQRDVTAASFVAYLQHNPQLCVAAFQLSIATVQVKDMEQGTEEVVAIADLPSHVAKLVQGLGERTLVATKRQAPATEQPPASSSHQKEAGRSSKASP